MIQMQTRLGVYDNSGVKKAQCIKILQGKKAQIGDIFLISVKMMRPRLKKITKITKGNILRALLIRTNVYSSNGIGLIKFDKNHIILLDKKNQPIGNRILGPVTVELRRKKLLKIISMASYII